MASEKITTILDQIDVISFPKRESAVPSAFTVKIEFTLINILAASGANAKRTALRSIGVCM